MRTVPTNMTIADYCKSMQRREITVNNDYQRSDKVWPVAARSYLVETVLLDFPVPKLSLHQKTDVKARSVVKEIVDGQQRSRALLDFYEGTFALAKSIETSDLIGLSFPDLDTDLQAQFLNYSLSIDLFTGASDTQVREVFRRMNSYTVPLNDEEQRHAAWQGSFKWFMHRLARRYDQSMLTMGLFTEKSLVRMQDTKLLTEVARALQFGIETTKRKQLDDMYRLHDDEFLFKEEWELRISGALDVLVSWNELYRSPLMKPHIVYALLLALIHVRQPVGTLQSVFRSERQIGFDRTEVLSRLTALAEGLTVPEEDRENLSPRVQEFVAAATGGTNVKAKREKRFVSFCRALTKAAEG